MVIFVIRYVYVCVCVCVCVNDGGRRVRGRNLILYDVGEGSGVLSLNFYAWRDLSKVIHWDETR